MSEAAAVTTTSEDTAAPAKGVAAPAVEAGPAVAATVEPTLPSGDPRAADDDIPIIADTGPLHYLILIGHIDILPRLLGKVVVPAAVCDEMLHMRAPRVVRDWMVAPPAWISVSLPALSKAGPSIERLGAGESAAISLAVASGSTLVLIDDRAGTEAARALDLTSVGTLGLLDLAAKRGLLSLDAAFASLQATNFHCHPNLLKAILAGDR